MAIQVEIDGYDSLEQIGVGGMAAVYKARKVSIDKTVAIKVLFPYLATDESYIERFRREAKAAASIQHENVVNVIDFGESNGSFFIVMEYYDGLTLEQLMKARAGVPFDISVQILLEVAFGLEAAHALDIVHRDIKPANIIYTNQGGIKIADFGLARKSDAMNMITQHGKVIGTPAYMSPEQAAGRPVGPSSDLFSLGVVAYELLSRRKPFEGKSYSDVLEKIQTYTPPTITRVNPLIVPEFEHVVSRMLAKDDRDRYAGASELIADLEAAMEKNKIARDRRRLSSYIKDPDAYDAAYLEKTVAACLSRGAFFMQKGHDHLEDAILEFRRILFLDPENERARKNLDRLLQERSESDRTMPIDVVVAPEATGAGPAGREGGRPAVAVARRVAPGRAAWAGIAVLAAGVAAVVWFPRGAEKAPAEGDSTRSAFVRAAGDTTHGRTGESALATAAPDSTREVPPADRTGRSKPSPQRDAARRPEPTMSASLSSPSPAGETDAAGSKATPAEGLGVKSPVTVAAKGETIKVAPAPPRPGTLSVYFLGGVGELWVNGRLFSHQPPFEDVTMPAGTYRIACRMSGDTAPHELTVTVRPDAETVVEYEVGGEPVVRAPQ